MSSPRFSLNHGPKRFAALVSQDGNVSRQAWGTRPSFTRNPTNPFTSDSVGCTQQLHSNTEQRKRGSHRLILLTLR